MKKYFNRSEDHQRFSLRKLTIGVASVLLGTTFMVFGTRTVHADDVNNQNNVNVETVQKNENSTDTDQSDSVKLNNKAEDQLKAGETAVDKTAKVETTQDNASKAAKSETTQDDVSKVAENASQDKQSEI